VCLLEPDPTLAPCVYRFNQPRCRPRFPDTRWCPHTRRPRRTRPEGGGDFPLNPVTRATVQLTVGVDGCTVARRSRREGYAPPPLKRHTAIPTKVVVGPAGCTVVAATGGRAQPSPSSTLTEASRAHLCYRPRQAVTVALKGQSRLHAAAGLRYPTMIVGPRSRRLPHDTRPASCYGLQQNGTACAEHPRQAVYS
jgi:hypothetical protein